MTMLAESLDVRDFTLAGLPTPITLTLPVPLTDDELIAFSRANRPYRIERDERGALEIMSPLGMEGGQRELFVMRALGDWADGHGGICVSSNAGFQLPEGAVRSPDASWTSDARLSGMTREQLRRFPPLAPDFLVEILSESDSRTRLEQKMELWISSGARLAWMIDPFAATLSVYRPREAVEVLQQPEVVEAHTVVAGFRLEMARLWAK